MASNGQTGPRTPEGKAISSQNATKHGLSAKETVVPDSQREEFSALREQLLGEINPQGALESLTFNQLLHAAWNLERAVRYEEEILNSAANPFTDETTAKQLHHLARYQTRHRRAYYRALKELRELQTARAIRDTSAEEDEAEAFGALVSVARVNAAKRNGARAAKEAVFKALDDYIEADPPTRRRQERPAV